MGRYLEIASKVIAEIEEKEKSPTLPDLVDLQEGVKFESSEDVEQKKVALNESTKATVNKEQVEGMTLEAFVKANLAVKVYSEVLGKKIYFVSNKRMKNLVKDEGLVIYLPHELEHLIRLKPGPEELGMIHQIKEVFPESQIVERTEKRDFR